MTPQVETWRATVQKVLRDLAVLEPWKFDVVTKLGLSQTDLENVVLGIIQQESSGNANAPDGDSGNSIGLMQLNWKVNQGDPDVFSYPYTDPTSSVPVFTMARNKDEVRDPYTNIACGTRYFMKWLNTYQDVNAAILSYNGPEEGQAYYASGDTTETGNFPYLEGVLSHIGVALDYFSTVVEKKTPLLLLLLAGGALLWYVSSSSSHKFSL